MALTINGLLPAEEYRLNATLFDLIEILLDIC